MILVELIDSDGKALDWGLKVALQNDPSLLSGVPTTLSHNLEIKNIKTIYQRGDAVCCTT